MFYLINSTLRLTIRNTISNIRLDKLVNTDEKNRHYSALVYSFIIIISFSSVIQLFFIFFHIFLLLLV